MAAILIHPTTASNPQAIADLERDTDRQAVIGEVAAELVVNSLETEMLRQRIARMDRILDDLAEIRESIEAALARRRP